MLPAVLEETDLGGIEMGSEQWTDGCDLWFFDELDDEEKQYALEQGCEPGKAYLGQAESACEAPQCPFCGST